jgi:hypothetical protein
MLSSSRQVVHVPSTLDEPTVEHRTIRYFSGMTDCIRVRFGQKPVPPSTMEDYLELVGSYGNVEEKVPVEFLTTKFFKRFIAKDVANINRIPEKYMSIELCKYVFECNLKENLVYIPLKYRTQEICNIATKIEPYNLVYVPYKFRTQKMVDMARDVKFWHSVIPIKYKPVGMYSNLRKSNQIPYDNEITFAFDRVTPLCLSNSVLYYVEPTDVMRVLPAKMLVVGEPVDGQFGKQSSTKKYSESDVIRTNENGFISPDFYHGLLSAMYQAYINHTPLRLRPDDLWISIIYAFGMFVTNHAEDVRDIFVNHAGKEEINVVVEPGTLDWENMIQGIVDQLKNRVKVDVVDWMKPDFTTTTQTDKIVSNIAMMQSMKEYFLYGCIQCCGISQVTLCGTRHDWELLCEKVGGLKQFKLPIFDTWSDILLNVLHKMMKPFDGIYDEDFWQRMVNYTGPDYGRSAQYSGWFLAFSPFNNKGKWQLNDIETINTTGQYGNVGQYNMPYCCGNVPFTAKDCYGNVTKYTIYAGLLSLDFNEETMTIAPSPEWIVVKEN